ncbi:MAG: RnfABCDGE type electron transport complex subunit D, partial [Clostridium sp.]|nr:RnfABCDGE type electron transport complex subunit D [Clostridium sp.]
MNENYNISSSPHIRAKVTSGNIMLMVVIALLPATIFGIYNFRHENAWLLVVVTTVSAVLAEYIYEKLMHKPITIKDWSAVVTGLLLALNLPPTLPLWMGALGSVFAIIVVKQLFGGLGQNFMNPALGARCF